jgi:hypothetical protein
MLNSPGLDKDKTATAAPRLSEVLFEQREHSFASLAALPSNVEAIEAAHRFSMGKTPFLAIVGPSGWGKTHLLQAVARRLSLECDATPDCLSVHDYLAGSAKPDASHLLLDDVQDLLARPRQRIELRLALERRVKAGRPALLAFSVAKANRQIKAFLPSSRDWTFATMGEAHPAERALVLNQMAVGEGLTLSPRLVRILANQMPGSARTLAGALKRLRLAGAHWLDAEDTLRALGVLDLCFTDNGDWDLKIKILKTADLHRTQFARVAPLDLALFVMLHKANLGEADVARSLGITPATAFHRAARFQEQAGSCDVTVGYVRQFIELVVGSLERD